MTDTDRKLEQRVARIERELGINPEVASFEEKVRHFVEYNHRYEIKEIADDEPKATLSTGVALTGNTYDDLLERFQEAACESHGGNLVVKVYGCAQDTDTDHGGSDE